MQIIVLGTTKREVLTSKVINKPHVLYLNQDWTPPEFTSSHIVATYGAHLEPRGYRCFRGHQEAMKMCTADVALIFEDDAIPNRADWYQIALDSAELLDKYDIVSLHARRVRGINQTFDHKNRKYATLNPSHHGLCWAFAALAYLVPKRIIASLSDILYTGIPWDIHIYNMNTCILLESPFDHDRKLGSILENCNKNLGTQKSSHDPI